MEEFLITNRAYGQYLVILALAAYAWLRGSGPEIVSGCIMAAAVIMALVYGAIFPSEFHQKFHGINPGLLVIDLFVFAALVPVAIRANRIYPLWLLGTQLIAVAMHFNRGANSTIGPMGYYLLVILPSYLQIIGFTFGLLAHRKRIRHFGPYPSWRIS